MSTDTAELEAEVVETPAEEQGEPEVESPPDGEAILSLGPDGMKLEDPDEHEVARAEAEGMVAVDPPKAEPEKPAPVTSGPEWELQQIAEVNRSVLEQQDVVDRMAKELKVEKGELESRQKQLNRLISEIAAKREASEPDPDRYPLYDRPATGAEAKALVNGMFPKPEAIPPLVETLDQFMQVRARETALESLGLGKRTLDKLARHGITLVAHAQGKSPQDMELTEKQAEEFEAVLSAFWEECTRVWEERHPEESPKPLDDDVERVLKGEFPHPDEEEQHRPEAGAGEETPT